MARKQAQPIDQRKRRRKGKLMVAVGALAAVVAFLIYDYEVRDLAGLGIACFVVAILVGAAGLSILYDTSDFVVENIPQPAPLNLQKTELWRQPTNFRFLEKLKAEYVKLEKELEEAYTRAVKVHTMLATTESRVAYNNAVTDLDIWQMSIGQYREAMDKLYPRIQRLFEGNVKAELFDIEEQIEKLKLRIANEKEAAQHAEQGSEQPGNLFDVIGLIVQGDPKKKLIELESVRKELREFDFEKLYKDLGVTLETVRAETEHLQDIKTKVEITTEVKNITNPKLTPEEEREQKRKALLEEINKLERERDDTLSKLQDEEIKRGLVNVFDDKIHRLSQQISEI